MRFFLRWLQFFLGISLFFLVVVTCSHWLFQWFGTLGAVAAGFALASFVAVWAEMS